MKNVKLKLMGFHSHFVVSQKMKLNFRLSQLKLRKFWNLQAMKMYHQKILNTLELVSKVLKCLTGVIWNVVKLKVERMNCAKTIKRKLKEDRLSIIKELKEKIWLISSICLIWKEILEEAILNLVYQEDRLIPLFDTVNTRFRI